MTRLSEIGQEMDPERVPDICRQWARERGLTTIPDPGVMRYIETLEARQQDLEQACILALSIFVNQEDIDKFPVLHQELKTVLAQHKREEAR